MKRIIYIFLACWLLPAAAQPLGHDVTSLLAYAKKHSQELAAMRFDADAASQRVQPAGSLPDPVLRTELMDFTNQGSNRPASLLPGNTGATRYLLTQSVPWYGRRELQSDVARAQESSARGQTAALWSDLSSKIKSAYAMHYFLTVSIRLTREMADLTQRLEKLTKTRYANGLGTQQEVIRAQLEQTDLQSTLIALENEQHHAHTQLNNLLSRPSEAPLADPETLRPLPDAARLAALDALVRTNNPQLQIAASAMDEARINRELSYKNRYPGFTLGIAPTQSGNTIKSWDLMVEFNIPLQQESRRSQEREAEARVAAATARQEALLNGVLSALAQSVSGLTSAQRTETLIATQLLPQTALSFESALNGYENGKVDFATLLDAQRSILKARSQQIKAQYEAQLRLAEIERLTGE
ncbi:TolC family protein [Gallionella capsiferriformans]|uniref:Outer membrane efflux protein n=1 Tax=Gallionella capsiferriformans (strain ES-2) TaxID=395494 RepID=D9SFT6_GALCS|nr:TolC family protein [Gallionella capsiferriformans]ADL55383.1 outer membrane efflux protein [Gallionella capsiferriformans ES-2]